MKNEDFLKEIKVKYISFERKKTSNKNYNFGMHFFLPSRKCM